MANFKPQTINNRIAAVNVYLEFKDLHKLKLSLVKHNKQPFTDGIITMKEYQQLLDYLKQHYLHGYFLVKFMANTGARISELLKFTKQDLEKGYVELHTKGKFRRINIPKALIAESKAFFTDKTDYLFLNRYGNTITSRGVSGVLKHYAEKAGVNRDVVHPHNFRHFFAIQFLKKNKNIALLADLLGHSNVNMTALYLRLSQKEQQKALNQAVDW